MSATIKERIYPVGRLDFASEGLLILTNDGDFTKWMTKAGVVPKVYHVKVAGKPEEPVLAKLRRGMFLDGERLAPCEINSAERRRQSLVRSDSAPGTGISKSARCSASPDIRWKNFAAFG